MAAKVTVLAVAALALVCCAAGGSLESKKVGKRSPQAVLEPAAIEESGGLVVAPGCRTLPFPYINYCGLRQCWRLPYSYQLVCYSAHSLPWPLAELAEEEKSAGLELGQSEAAAGQEESSAEARSLAKRSTEEAQDEAQDETNSIVILPGCRTLPFPYINYCSLRQCWRVPFTYRVVCRGAHSGVILSESAEQGDSSGEDS